MQRRNLLIGMGSLAAGGAATIGTGAFTSVEAERTVSVSVADDANALLGLTQAGTGANSQYAEVSGGRVTIDLDNTDTQNGGGGVNKDADTKILDIFRIKNQGTQPVFVYVDPDSISPEIVTPDAGGGYAKYFEGTEDGIYIDPQASNRPNDNIEGDQNFAGQAVSMTGVYGVHDPTTGFEGRDPSSSTDLKAEDLTLGVGQEFSFGLKIRKAGDANNSFDMTMDIVADASLAATLD